MMIKNLKIKCFLNNTIFPLLSLLNKLLPHEKKQILLYCNLNFRDNNKAIYDYLIDNEYNKTYKIIVSASDYRQYISKSPMNVSFVGAVMAIFYFFTSRYVFYCIGKIPIEPGKGQVVIHMEHGMPVKGATDGQLKVNSYKHLHFTHLLATGKVFVPIRSRIYSFPENKIIITGNPKCDSLYLPSPQYDFGDYKKIVLWAPTFRKSSSMNMNDSLKEEPILPIVSIEDFKSLDDYLKSLDVKIVVKLHPEQDLSEYHIINMNNFILMSHQDFIKKGMDLYRFMKQCDAIITDYSSIYYDFLLLDRPIGFTEDDIDDYAGKRGFSIDLQTFRPGQKIKKLSDLFKFVKDLTEGIDNYKSERFYINTLVNEDMEGNFCYKVLKIIGVNK